MLVLLLAAVTVDAALIEGLPREQARFAAHGRTQACEGVSLHRVLVKLGAPAGQDLRGPGLTTVATVTARDGYRVAFTLGELDPMLGGKRVLLADRCDGKRLRAEDGPYRLVVPGEQRAARSARQVATLEITPAPSSPRP